MSSTIGYAGRVTQLDALTLDGELEKFLKNECLNIGNHFDITEFLTRWRHELDLCLQFILWKYSTYDKGWTVGQKLLGIKYFPINKRSLVILFILESVLPYVRKRFSTSIPEKLEKWIDPIYKSLKIINFCLFLLQNDYPMLSHRILKLKMVSENLNAGSPGYSFQIRELLWHQLTDFLLIVLPLVSLPKVKKYWKYFRSSKVKPSAQSQVKIVETDSRNRKCCICGQEPFAIPQIKGNCIFCYYCISSQLIADPDFECHIHSVEQN